MLKRSPKTNNVRPPAVVVRDCTVELGNQTILENVSFEAATGQIAAIIGPNGSGKTTLVRAIIGLVPIENGEIKVFGKPFRAVRDQVGYVPQRFSFDHNFPITVGEFLDLARHPRCPKSRLAEKLKEVGLPNAIAAERLGNLSGGQIQRVLIAQAILNDPKLLIMDEPASGIDIAGEQTLNDIIQHLNEVHDTTVILVSHDIAMISDLVDNVICVNRRLLCFGPPKNALTARKISEIFGSENVYEHHHDHALPPDGPESANDQRPVTPHEHHP